MTRWCLALAAAAALLSPLPADTYHVAPGGADDPARDGRGPETAWKTLAYACGRVPAGGHTIQLAAGVYAVDATATAKDGVAIRGAGADGDAATVLRAAREWPLGPADALPKPTSEYMLLLKKAKGVSVSGIAFESDPGHRISGAVYATGCDGVAVTDCAFREFRWAAVYAEHSSKFTLGRCAITNGATDKDKHHSGAVRTKWLKDSEIHDNAIVNTTGSEYGYKAGGHENVRFHHNRIEVKGEFAFESAHDNEFGLDVHHNEFNRCVSVPKPGQGADPNTRGFEYSVWIHHNKLTDSYTVEGPRNHLRISHNWVPIEKTGGRVYSVHGGVSDGPVWIHNNVVENLDRAFVWKNQGRSDHVEVCNNTVYCADSPRAAAVIDVFQNEKNPVSGWVVRNNVFVAPKAQPRKFFHEQYLANGRIDASHNLVVNVSNAPKGSWADLAPDFPRAGDRPVPFYAPGRDAAVVGKGAELKLPGAARPTTLGAVAAGEPFEAEYGPRKK